MQPASLPPKIRMMKRCQRCGSVYPRKAADCPVCNDVEDGPALEALKKQRKAGLVSFGLMDISFLLAAAILLLLLLGSAL